MTPQETAQRLLALDHILILTHRRPDGDTIGCASALCLAPAAEGKDRLAPAQRGCPPPLRPLSGGGCWPGGLCPPGGGGGGCGPPWGCSPDSAQPYRDRIDLAIDHHGSQECYARATCVDPDSAACGGGPLPGVPGYGG